MIVVSCSVLFQSAATNAFESSPFQIVFTTLPNMPPERIVFSQLRIEFSDPQFNISKFHDPSSHTSTPSKQWLELTSSASETDLAFVSGMVKIFEGKVVPTTSGDLKITKVEAIVESGIGRVCLCYKISERVGGLSERKRRRWYRIDGSTSCIFLFDQKLANISCF